MERRGVPIRLFAMARMINSRRAPCAALSYPHERIAMPKTPSSAPRKKPVTAKKKAVTKTARKTVAAPVAEADDAPVRATAAGKSATAKALAEKRPRARVLLDAPQNIAVDPEDADALARRDALASGGHRARSRRSAVDRLNDPPADASPAVSLVARVGDAIERELRKIERIIGNPVRLHPSERIESESRARVLASLARSMKEVMRLREQERDAMHDATKAADDDAIPRDLDEFRRELSRRLEGLVGSAAPLPAGGHEPG
jgi:hypothetical protein